jgi:transposase
MELIRILNRCHRFRGFVYQHAHFSADKKSIEVAVRPRKGSTAACSRCHLPAPGYDQLAERRDLLRYNLKTVRAYLLKEAFQQLWEYSSPAWAGKFLDEWCRQTMRSRIEPMKKIARSLRNHRELILNYFRAQKMLSSGVVEGLNNKAKVTMRKSDGFRTYRVLELALYHSLGKLPEPESTHDFF